LHRCLPDQGVNFLGLDVIHFLHCILDLLLVCSKVNNENQSVVVLNLLHCRLSGKWVLQDLIMVKLVPGWHTDARILRTPVLLQSLRPVESHRSSDLLRLLLKDSTRLNCLSSFQGLCLWITLLRTINYTHTQKENQ